MSKMNVTKIQIDEPSLLRCVKMVNTFDSSLIKDDDIITITHQIIERVRHQFSSVSLQKEPFGSYQTSIAPCIQVSYVKVYDKVIRQYLTDTVKCVFTVQPVVVSEANDPLSTFNVMTREEAKKYLVR